LEKGAKGGKRKKWEKEGKKDYAKKKN